MRAKAAHGRFRVQLADKWFTPGHPKAPLARYAFEQSDQGRSTENVRRFRCLVIASLAAIGFATPAQAHPLGNFTINHLAKVRIADHGLTIRYVVDMAEIPTFQVMSERSIEGNERSARLAQWGRDEIGVIQSGLGIRADGQALALVAGIPRVSTRPGAGGLPTLYFVDEFRAAFPNGGSPRTVTIEDRTYSGRIGWKDISVAPDTEPTNELRAYPNALLGSPRSISAVSITLAPNGRIIARWVSEDELQAPAGSTSQVRSNLLSDMLAKGLQNPFIVLLTFFIAIGLGALHALEPGHGKTLLAVSLVGARATPKQALFLALALTFAHTAGVLALGIVLLVLAQWIVPENVYPWVTLASGVLVAAFGAAALSRYVKARRGLAHGHGHHYPSQGLPTAPLSFKSVVLIAMSGNIAPCPAALVVLLTALTLHQVGYGLLVVVAFSLGLATVLTGLGIAVVRGASWLSQRRGFDRLVHYGPPLTAVIIVSIGTVMIAKASAIVLQTPVLFVALLVLGAITGYALSPGHTHGQVGHSHAHAHYQPPAMLEKEAT